MTTARQAAASTLANAKTRQKARLSHRLVRAAGCGSDAAIPSQTCGGGTT